MTLSLAPAGIGKRDLWVLAWLAVPVLVLFGGTFASGRTFFWGDLLYLHHPWRALAAEMIGRGALPLWNPFAYLGMPLAGQMQCAAWYPGTLPFYVAGFVPALAFYHVVHFWLAGAFTFLWLRRLGYSRFAAAGAAAAYMLCGGLVSRIPFLNHVSTLAFFPALLLFADRPLSLALALTLAFLGGYPPMLAGAAAAAWLISAALAAGPASAAPAAGSKRDGTGARRGWAIGGAGRLTAGWIAAGTLSLGLGACLLLPAADLTRDSRRSGGIEAGESLTWSFEPRDLIQLTAPPLMSGEEYSPTTVWWKTAYWGGVALGAALAGLVRLPAAAAAAAAAYLAGVVLVLLGGTNPASLWVWTHFAPLHYVRYPGNMAYLTAPVLVLLVAGGLHRRRVAPLAALAIVVELFAYGMGAQPAVPRGYFTDAGPLVGTLRRELGGHRYLISPLALQWHRGRGTDAASASLDIKHRLYGLTNMPYHLSSAGNFGEPLVPRRSYDFMDFLYRRGGLAEAAEWLGWADVRLLMTRDRLAPDGLEYLGDSLWHLYRKPGPGARAFWFDEEAGRGIPAGLRGPAPDLGRGVALELEGAREDRFRVAGDFPRPGWLYVAEPLGPGWRARGGGPPEPALGAFWKLRVPAGRWSVDFRYAPSSWRLGRSLTLLLLCALAAYWYNRFRRGSPT
ncbi:MAG: hypothetical protein ABII00_08000 [Elusimicrobiota bacterium]